jgi:perosamine synthetase
MKAAGVGTSVYYPVPIPLSTYYQTKYGAQPEAFPNAARISDQSIALPVGPHLDESDMAQVAAALLRALEVAR